MLTYMYTCTYLLLLFMLTYMYTCAQVTGDVKNLITIFPVWSLYRGLAEYKEYGGASVASGQRGITWLAMREDPDCGFPAVLLVLAIEWPIFILIALYLDQVIR